MSGVRHGSILMALAASVSGAPAQPAGQDEAVLAAFRANCAICHGEAGEGLVGPPLRPLPVTPADARLVVRSGQGQMPPFSAEQLPEATLDALLHLLEGWK